MHSYVKTVIAASLLLLLSAAALTVGTVMKPTVTELAETGELAVLSRAGKPFTIYPASVRLPGPGEPYYEQARAAVFNKLSDQQVGATLVAWGPNGEKVVDIDLEGEDINAWLISEGHGWVLREWVHRPELLELEAEARAEGRGLWALDAYENGPPES